MRFLIDPDELTRRLPRDARAVPASAGELPVALRSIVAVQPEFADWIPSQLCLFTFRRIAGDGFQVSHKERRKAPALVLWTVPVTDGSSGDVRHLALAVYTNAGRLERPAEMAGLELRKARTTFGPVPPDDEGRPSDADRTTLRIGKTSITWDGRAAGDSAAPSEAYVEEWRAEGARGGWVDGTFRLEPRVKNGMIGSLKVEGKDALAKMLRESPVRFVGPGFRGGQGAFEFQR